MKNLRKKWLALVLSVALAVGFAVPAQAQQVQYLPVAPIAVTVDVSQVLNVPGPMPGDTQDYHATVEAAAETLRQQLVDRETVAVTTFTTTEDYDQQLLLDVFNAAIAHTGAPDQGDYLRWQMGECSMELSGYASPTQAYLTLSYTPVYYTTADQEAQVDLAVESLLDQLDVYDASDYEKVRAVYDYICTNVTYDYEGLEAKQSDLIYTAYAALINKTAVCQGYANLFYRLALELDVDARLIAGKGNNQDHGWNIVKLDGKYYNLDATWDAPRLQANREYDYFLLCDAHFDDHAPNAEYLTEEFRNAYPMATVDFSLSPAPITGDIDGDEEATVDDVICLLLYVTMPDVFEIYGEADFDGDNAVTVDDVICLLLHVTMPDAFPL